MALSDLILQHIPTMGLWFVKTRTTSIDISQLIYDLSVKGSVFLRIFSSDKERIINSVISMIIKDRLQEATCSYERVLIESGISYYHEFGFFDALLQELNDYIMNGYFWEHQVYIEDFDPLFFENYETETILIDEIQVFNKKSIFVFVHEKSSIFADEFVLKRLINT